MTSDVEIVNVSFPVLANLLGRRHADTILLRVRRDLGQLTALGAALESEGGPVSLIGRELRLLSEAFDFDGLGRLDGQLKQAKG